MNTHRLLIPAGIAALALLPTILPLPGCTNPDPPPTSEVMTLQVCPIGTPCAKIADNASHVTVEGCLAEGIKEPRTDLRAEFRLSDGAWIDPAPPTTTPRVVLTPMIGRCVTARFRTPADPQSVRVRFQLVESVSVDTDGVTKADKYLPYAAAAEIPIEPAPIDYVSFAPTLGPYIPEAPTFLLDVFARTKIGQPSNGTSILLKVVSASPAGAAEAVRITPDRVTVSSAASALNATVVPGTAQTITILAVATPPSPVTGTALPAVSTSITLSKAPPPALDDAGTDTEP